MITPYRGLFYIGGGFSGSTKKFIFHTVKKLFDIPFTYKDVYLKIAIPKREYYYKWDALQLIDLYFDVKFRFFPQLSGGIGKEIKNMEKSLDYFKMRSVMFEDTAKYWHNTYMLMTSCYSRIDRSYVGNPDHALFLINKGITKHVQSIHKNGEGTANIGFCEKGNKWYGWSHRAIYGFEIGCVAKKGDCVTTTGYIDEYIKDHPEDDLSVPVGFKAKSLADCKKMAIAFAESVS